MGLPVMVGSLYGWSGRLGLPLDLLVAGSCLVQRLLASYGLLTVSGGGLLQKPGVGGLVLHYWWVESASRKSQGCCPTTVGEAKSWSLVAGPRGPRTCVLSLVGEAAFSHSWLQGPGCLEPSVGLLMVGARAQLVSMEGSGLLVGGLCL